MTRVDFYQINDTETTLQFACRLIDKIYSRGYRVHVHTGDPDSASALNDLLWSFRDDRFIPHCLYATKESAPIKIGVQEEPTEHQEVLINLSGAIPHFFSRFERVAEVVPLDENSRSSARENYRIYKDRGYALDYHQIAARQPG